MFSLQVPQSENEWKLVAREFEKRWNFPHCIGAIDGKHVEIRKPPGTGSYYFNYKHSFSIVLMCIVNANYEFLMVDVGANGRVSDGGVFSNTFSCTKLKLKELCIREPDNLPESDMKIPYVSVGNDAFPLMANLIKPFSHRNLSMEDRIFNYRLSQARRIVENAFGLLASRFRILLGQINVCPEKAVALVLACCCLRNYLRRKEVESYYQGGFDIENISSGVINDADWRSGRTLLALQHIQGRNTTGSAKETRQNFHVTLTPWGLFHGRRIALN